MSKIVSVHSFRGGTGKSNITANVSALIASKGKRVGVIDTDIQSPGIHVLFKMDEEKIDKALNDYLWGKCDVKDAAYNVSAQIGLGAVIPMSGNIWLIPASIKAGEITKVLREGYDVKLLNDGFGALIQKLDLDYLFIDTHPGLNEETLLSIAISDFLLIIMRPDQQDFQGTAVTVDVARKLEVPHLHIVINKALLPPPEFGDLRQKAIDSLRDQVSAKYEADVAAVLPLSEDIARMQSSDIFSLHYPEHPWAQGIFQIVAAIESAK